MLLVNQCKCPLDTPIEQVDQIICLKLKIRRDQLISYTLVKESLDSRKGKVQLIYSALVEVADEEAILINKNPDVSVSKKEEYQACASFDVCPDERPIIVGFGPCGMLAGLILAEAGLKPIILERGSQVEQRVEDVENYWKTGVLKPNSNVQYGEGGAGTFSDGKLTTRTKDQRIVKVIDELIEAGAFPEIRYQAHPHIGTDKLRSIVKNIREKIIRLGGTIHFNSQVTDFKIENKTIRAVKANDHWIESSIVMLAIGHSARDTLKQLFECGVQLEPKSFAIGARIEHPQSLINKSQYKEWAQHPRLSSAEYRLTYTCENQRGVYTFCMCPGGSVVASASDEGQIVTNGMSEHARDQQNANSALLVQVNPSDFGSDHPLAGIDFQLKLEQAAWNLGKKSGRAPAQTALDFIARRPSVSLGKTIPSYPLGVELCDLHDLFPAEISESLEEALQQFDRRIGGFIREGVLTGVETRSSCPVRIVRQELYQSIQCSGLYPAGEGAGYAGGIVSSAIDGIRIAEQIIRDIHSHQGLLQEE